MAYVFYVILTLRQILSFNSASATNLYNNDNNNNNNNNNKYNNNNNYFI